MKGFGAVIGGARRSRCRSLCLAFLVATGTVVSHADAASLDEAAERYRSYMIEDIGRALAGARSMREYVVARDLGGAKQAWIDSRAGWERSEVFTSGFAPDLDQKIDAWPDARSGFHAIEARLFGANTVNVEEQTDTLIAHLAELDAEVRHIALTPQGLLNGITRLAYEVGESKMDGGESRFSGTSLDDMRNNVDGIRLAYRTIFAAALEASDPKLATSIQTRIDELGNALDVANLKRVDPAKLRTLSEELVVALQASAPKIGLGKPSLEESSSR
jgi:iron uptake system component EfeO